MSDHYEISLWSSFFDDDFPDSSVPKEEVFYICGDSVNDSSIDLPLDESEPLSIYLGVFLSLHFIVAIVLILFCVKHRMKKPESTLLNSIKIDKPMKKNALTWKEIYITISPEISPVTLPERSLTTIPEVSNTPALEGKSNHTMKSTKKRTGVSRSASMRISTLLKNQIAEPLAPEDLRVESFDADCMSDVTEDL